nr:hypothetical protein [Tanacetum cinerariifolium]
MQEELLQFQIQKVWILVDLPFGKKAFRTNWVYRNKKDERGVVIRNKARLVAHGHRQEEGIDYDELFALVARIGAIRIFLAFASYMGFILYQMDVKSAFLYGTINEEDKNDIMLVQVYVDDIIFGSTKKTWCDEFLELIKNRFQMSSMGELTFFLRLQVQQKKDGIFISQDKYVTKILTNFDFLSVKTASTLIKTQKPLVKDEEAADVDVHLYRSMFGSLMYLTASRPDIMFAVYACSRFQVTPMTSHLQVMKRIFRYLKGQPKLGLWYPKVSSFDLEAYSDSDYAGANLDRKSTTGGCQFLGRRLISWQCKKQTIMATSTTEAEYVAAAHCSVAEGEDLGTPTESQATPSPTQPSAGDQPPLSESSSDHDSSQEPRVDLEGTCGSEGDQVHLLHDSPLSGGYTSNRAEGSLNLKALYALCTNLSNRVLALETVNDAQAKEILTLKAKKKKFERRYTLIKLKDDKAKGVAFKDSKSTDRTARSILTLKPLLIIDPKDKGKGVLEEHESANKMTKSDFDVAQIARDEEIARKLEVELQQAVRWTHEEHEKYTVDERAKLLAEYFERRKKKLAEERTTAIRNKPPTKTQLRRLMINYPKNMDFVPIGSKEDERMIRDLNKKAEEEISDKDVDNTKKRKEGSRMKRMSKRQKTDVDLEEKEKLKTFLKIDLDEEGVIDYEVLDKRFPIINWE